MVDQKSRSFIFQLLNEIKFIVNLYLYIVLEGEIEFEIIVLIKIWDVELNVVNDVEKLIEEGFNFGDLYVVCDLFLQLIF